MEKIVKIILIYFSINLGLRIIIDFVLFLLIRIMCVLMEPIDIKLKKNINYIIEHRLEPELEANIFKLLTGYIHYLISEKYTKPSKLENSLIIKFKYAISKFLDKLYDKSYQLVFSYKVLRNRKKLKHCIAINIVNLKHCIKSIFKICLFNFFVLGIGYYYFIDKNEVINAISYFEKFDYTKFLNYIALILPLPIIKTIYDYIKVKLLLKNECNELKNKCLNLFKFIEKNIEKVDFYKVENEIECIAEEITNNIGFEFENGKLKIQHRRSYNMYSKEKNRLYLESVTEEIDKINNFITDKFIKENKFKVEKYFFIIPYFFEVYEKNILDYKTCIEYKKLCEYFEKNNNQIYKCKFTDVRVVEEKRIILLDLYIERCENWLKNYRNEFTEYTMEMLILDCEVKKHLIYMNRVLFSTRVTDALKTIISTSIMEYLEIIKKILY